MPFVVDASMTASWRLPDEQEELALACYQMLMTDEARVPPIWRFEVCNLLVMAERRNRIPSKYADTALRLLEDYPIVEDASSRPEMILAIARSYSLSAYDAAYLELAQRTRFPLATLDNGLVRAARSANVALVE